MFAESVSQQYSTKFCSSIIVCLKKMINGEIICHLKRILKRLCYYKWKAWYTLSKSGLKKLHISIIHHQSSFRAVAPNIAIGLGTKYFVAIKEPIESLYFPWRKINWHVFQIAKAHFSYSIWLMISEKSIMLCYSVHVSSSWCCMHLPRVSANKAYKKNCLQEFRILSALNYYTFMCTCGFYRY